MNKSEVVIDLISELRYLIFRNREYELTATNKEEAIKTSDIGETALLGAITEEVIRISKDTKHIDSLIKTLREMNTAHRDDRTSKLIELYEKLYQFFK